MRGLPPQRRSHSLRGECDDLGCSCSESSCNHSSSLGKSCHQDVVCTLGASFKNKVQSTSEESSVSVEWPSQSFLRNMGPCQMKSQKAQTEVWYPVVRAGASKRQGEVHGWPHGSSSPRLPRAGVNRWLTCSPACFGRRWHDCASVLEGQRPPAAHSLGMSGKRANFGMARSATEPFEPGAP